MTTYIAVNPVEARKAAAFVEKLGALETEFGYFIAADSPVGVYGATSPFAFMRVPEQDGLAFVVGADQ